MSICSSTCSDELPLIPVEERNVKGKLWDTAKVLALIVLVVGAGIGIDALVDPSNFHMWTHKFADIMNETFSSPYVLLSCAVGFVALGALAFTASAKDSDQKKRVIIEGLIYLAALAAIAGFVTIRDMHSMEQFGSDLMSKPIELIVGGAVTALGLYGIAQWGKWVFKKEAKEDPPFEVPQPDIPVTALPLFGIAQLGTCLFKKKATEDLPVEAKPPNLSHLRAQRPRTRTSLAFAPPPPNLSSQRRNSTAVAAGTASAAQT
jgi:hypothetical protein